MLSSLLISLAAAWPFSHDSEITFGKGKPTVVGTLKSGDETQIKYYLDSFYDQMVKDDCYPTKLEICHSVAAGEFNCETASVRYAVIDLINEVPDLDFSTIVKHSVTIDEPSTVSFRFKASGNWGIKGDSKCHYVDSSLDYAFTFQ